MADAIRRYESSAEDEKILRERVRAKMAQKILRPPHVTVLSDSVLVELELVYGWTAKKNTKKKGVTLVAR